MDPFPEHTLDSAPPAARRAMAGTAAELGFLPAGMARQATSPELLDAFLRANALFEASTLDPLAREVLVMTMAVRNGCHLCVAMHTARLVRMSAADELVAALRAGHPLADARLDAVRVFTLAVLATAGAPGDAALHAFLGAGFTPRQALEVVLGIGTYTLSTFANRLTGAPVDDQLAAYA